MEQICIALKRIFVHEKIFEEFKAAMIKATAALKVGEGNEPDVFLGPIQNEMQYDRVKGFFEDVRKEKYNVVAGGENPTGPGYFITPTIVDRPPADSRLVLEEPFGKRPFSCLITLTAQMKSSQTPYFRLLPASRTCTRSVKVQLLILLNK